MACTLAGLHDGLLVAEAAFAVVLIVGASLLARSFVRLMEFDNGYTANGVLIAIAELPRGATDAQTDQFIQGVLDRVRAMRGVSAGASGMISLISRTAVVAPENFTPGTNYPRLAIPLRGHPRAEARAYGRWQRLYTRGRRIVRGPSHTSHSGVGCFLPEEVDRAHSVHERPPTMGIASRLRV